MTVRKFTIIREVVRVAAEGDILFRTFKHHSILTPLVVSGDAQIVFPRIVHNPVVDPIRITTGDDFNFLFPLLTHTSSFPGLTIQESPADGEILLPTLTHTSSFPGLEIDESPADGEILLPTLIHTSTVNALAVTEAESDGSDGSIGGGSIEDGGI